MTDEWMTRKEAIAHVRSVAPNEDARARISDFMRSKEITVRPKTNHMDGTIFLKRADVYRIWPPTQLEGPLVSGLAPKREYKGPSDLTKPLPVAAPRRGGRPTKYDWMNIAAEASDYIVRNDPRETRQLVAAIKARMDESDLPDLRALERFCKGLLEKGRRK